MCSLRTEQKWPLSEWNPPPPICVSKMAVIFYLLNSEEIHFFAPKDCRCNLLLSIQIIFPLENSSSIGIRKSGTNQLEYILLIEHWNWWRRVKEGAEAPPPWFLSFKFQTVYIKRGLSSKGTSPNAGKKHKCYKSSMNIDNFSPFSNVWIFGE